MAACEIEGAIGGGKGADEGKKTYALPAVFLIFATVHTALLIPFLTNIYWIESTGIQYECNVGTQVRVGVYGLLVLCAFSSLIEWSIVCQGLRGAPLEERKRRGILPLLHAELFLWTVMLGFTCYGTFVVSSSSVAPECWSNSPCVYSTELTVSCTHDKRGYRELTPSCQAIADAGTDVFYGCLQVWVRDSLASALVVSQNDSVDFRSSSGQLFEVPASVASELAETDALGGEEDEDGEQVGQDADADADADDGQQTAQGEGSARRRALAEAAPRGDRTSWDAPEREGADRRGERAKSRKGKTGDEREGRREAWPGDEREGRREAWPGDEREGRREAWPGDEREGRREAWPGDEREGRREAWPGDEREGRREAWPGDEPAERREAWPGDEPAERREAWPGDEPAERREAWPGDEPAERREAWPGDEPAERREAWPGDEPAERREAWPGDEREERREAWPGDEPAERRGEPLARSRRSQRPRGASPARGGVAPRGFEWPGGAAASRSLAASAASSPVSASPWSSPPSPLASASASPSSLPPPPPPPLSWSTLPPPPPPPPTWSTLPPSSSSSSSSSSPSSSASYELRIDWEKASSTTDGSMVSVYEEQASCEAVAEMVEDVLSPLEDDGESLVITFTNQTIPTVPVTASGSRIFNAWLRENPAYYRDYLLVWSNVIGATSDPARPGSTAPWFDCLNDTCQAMVEYTDDCEQWDVLLRDPKPSNRKIYALSLVYSSWAVLALRVILIALTFNSFPDYDAPESWEGSIGVLARLCCCGGTLQGTLGGIDRGGGSGAGLAAAGGAQGRAAVEQGLRNLGDALDTIREGGEKALGDIFKPRGNEPKRRADERGGGDAEPGADADGDTDDAPDDAPDGRRQGRDDQSWELSARKWSGERRARGTKSEPPASLHRAPLDPAPLPPGRGGRTPATSPPSPPPPSPHGRPGLGLARSESSEGLGNASWRAGDGLSPSPHRSAVPRPPGPDGGPPAPPPPGPDGGPPAPPPPGPDGGPPAPPPPAAALVRSWSAPLASLDEIEALRLPSRVNRALDVARGAGSEAGAAASSAAGRPVAEAPSPDEIEDRAGGEADEEDGKDKGKGKGGREGDDRGSTVGQELGRALAALFGGIDLDPTDRIVGAVLASFAQSSRRKRHVRRALAARLLGWERERLARRRSGTAASRAGSAVGGGSFVGLPVGGGQDGVPAEPDGPRSRFAPSDSFITVRPASGPLRGGSPAGSGLVPSHPSRGGGSLPTPPHLGDDSYSFVRFASRNDSSLGTDAGHARGATSSEPLVAAAATASPSPASRTRRFSARLPPIPRPPAGAGGDGPPALPPPEDGSASASGDGAPPRLASAPYLPTPPSLGLLPPSGSSTRESGGVLPPLAPPSAAAAAARLGSDASSFTMVRRPTIESYPASAPVVPAPPPSSDSVAPAPPLGLNSAAAPPPPPPPPSAPAPPGVESGLPVYLTVSLQADPLPLEELDSSKYEESVRRRAELARLRRRERRRERRARRWARREAKATAGAEGAPCGPETAPKPAAARSLFGGRLSLQRYALSIGEAGEPGAGVADAGLGAGKGRAAVTDKGSVSGVESDAETWESHSSSSEGSDASDSDSSVSSSSFSHRGSWRSGFFGGSGSRHGSHRGERSAASLTDRGRHRRRPSASSAPLTSFEWDPDAQSPFPASFELRPPEADAEEGVGGAGPDATRSAAGTSGQALAALLEGSSEDGSEEEGGSGRSDERPGGAGEVPLPGSAAPRSPPLSPRAPPSRPVGWTKSVRFSRAVPGQAGGEARAEPALGEADPPAGRRLRWTLGTAGSAEARFPSALSPPLPLPKAPRGDSGAAADRSVSPGVSRSRSAPRRGGRALPRSPASGRAPLDTSSTTVQDVGVPHALPVPHALSTVRVARAASGAGLAHGGSGPALSGSSLASAALSSVPSVGATSVSPPLSPTRARSLAGGSPAPPLRAAFARLGGTEGGSAGPQHASLAGSGGASRRAEVSWAELPPEAYGGDVSHSSGPIAPLVSETAARSWSPSAGARPGASPPGSELAVPYAARARALPRFSSLDSGGAAEALRWGSGEVVSSAPRQHDRLPSEPPSDRPLPESISPAQSRGWYARAPSELFSFASFTNLASSIVPGRIRTALGPHGGRPDDGRGGGSAGGLAPSSLATAAAPARVEGPAVKVFGLRQLIRTSILVPDASGDGAAARRSGRSGGPSSALGPARDLEEGAVPVAAAAGPRSGGGALARGRAHRRRAEAGARAPGWGREEVEFVELAGRSRDAGRAEDVEAPRGALGRSGPHHVRNGPAGGRARDGRRRRGPSRSPAREGRRERPALALRVRLRTVAHYAPLLTPAKLPSRLGRVVGARAAAETYGGRHPPVPEATLRRAAALAGVAVAPYGLREALWAGGRQQPGWLSLANCAVSCLDVCFPSLVRAWLKRRNVALIRRAIGEGPWEFMRGVQEVAEEEGRSAAAKGRRVATAADPSRAFGSGTGAVETAVGPMPAPMPAPAPAPAPAPPSAAVPRLTPRPREPSPRASAALSDGPSPTTLLTASYESRPHGLVPYLVSLHAPTKSVCISVRGTVGMEDLVTDLLSFPVDIADWIPPGALADAEDDGGPLLAHAGIVESTTAVFVDLFASGVLEDLVDAQMERQAIEEEEEMARQVAEAAEAAEAGGGMARQAAGAAGGAGGGEAEAEADEGRRDERIAPSLLATREGARRPPLEDGVPVPLAALPERPGPPGPRPASSEAAADSGAWGAETGAGEPNVGSGRAPGIATSAADEGARPAASGKGAAEPPATPPPSSRHPPGSPASPGTPASPAAGSSRVSSPASLSRSSRAETVPAELPASPFQQPSPEKRERELAEERKGGSAEAGEEGDAQQKTTTTTITKASGGESTGEEAGAETVASAPPRSPEALVPTAPAAPTRSPQPPVYAPVYPRPSASQIRLHLSAAPHGRPVFPPHSPYRLPGPPSGAPPRAPSSTRRLVGTTHAPMESLPSFVRPASGSSSGRARSGRWSGQGGGAGGSGPFASRDASFATVRFSGPQPAPSGAGGGDPDAAPSAPLSASFGSSVSRHSSPREPLAPSSGRGEGAGAGAGAGGSGPLAQASRSAPSSSASRVVPSSSSLSHRAPSIARPPASLATSASLPHSRLRQGAGGVAAAEGAATAGVDSSGGAVSPGSVAPADDLAAPAGADSPGATASVGPAASSPALPRPHPSASFSSAQLRSPYSAAASQGVPLPRSPYSMSVPHASRLGPRPSAFASVAAVDALATAAPAPLAAPSRGGGAGRGRTSEQSAVDRMAEAAIALQTRLSSRAVLFRASIDLSERHSGSSSAQSAFGDVAWGAAPGSLRRAGSVAGSVRSFGGSARSLGGSMRSLGGSIRSLGGLSGRLGRESDREAPADARGEPAPEGDRSRRAVALAAEPPQSRISVPASRSDASGRETPRDWAGSARLSLAESSEGRDREVAVDRSSDRSGPDREAAVTRGSDRSRPDGETSVVRGSDRSGPDADADAGAAAADVDAAGEDATPPLPAPFGDRFSASLSLPSRLGAPSLPFILERASRENSTVSQRPVAAREAPGRETSGGVWSEDREGEGTLAGAAEALSALSGREAGGRGRVEGEAEVRTGPFSRLEAAAEEAAQETHRQAESPCRQPHRSVEHLPRPLQSPSGASSARTSRVSLPRAAGSALSGAAGPSSRASEPSASSEPCSAEDVVPRALRRAMLRKAIVEDGYTVVVTGHSLGAAVACLLALQLRPRLPHAECWCFSPPGGLVSWNLARATRRFCTSVVAGKDAITRLSFANAKRAVDEVVLALARCPDPKLAVAFGLATGLTRAGRRELPLRRVPDEAVERLARYHAISARAPKALLTEMYPPGNIVFLRPFKVRAGDADLDAAPWNEPADRAAGAGGATPEAGRGDGAPKGVGRASPGRGEGGEGGQGASQLPVGAALGSSETPTATPPAPLSTLQAPSSPPRASASVPTHAALPPSLGSSDPRPSSLASASVLGPAASAPAPPLSRAAPSFSSLPSEPAPPEPPIDGSSRGFALSYPPLDGRLSASAPAPAPATLSALFVSLLVRFAAWCRRLFAPALPRPTQFDALVGTYRDRIGRAQQRSKSRSSKAASRPASRTGGTAKAAEARAAGGKGGAGSGGGSPAPGPSDPPRRPWYLCSPLLWWRRRGTVGDAGEGSTRSPSPDGKPLGSPTPPSARSLLSSTAGARVPSGSDPSSSSSSTLGSSAAAPQAEARTRWDAVWVDATVLIGEGIVIAPSMMACHRMVTVARAIADAFANRKGGNVAGAKDAIEAAERVGDIAETLGGMVDQGSDGLAARVLIPAAAKAFGDD